MLFKVYNKETFEDVTNRCRMCSNGDFYIDGESRPADPDLYFVEWRNIKVAIGNGSWQSYLKNNGFYLFNKCYLYNTNPKQK